MTRITLLFTIAALVATLAQSTLALPVSLSGPSVGKSLSTMTGFATLNGGTTGGLGSQVVTVNNVVAFTKAVADDKPRTVILKGILKITGQIDVGSHKTILGADANSGFTGGGLRVKGSTNVVIRNLKFSLPKGTDSISLQHATNVWIDHNEFSSEKSHGKDYYDGLLDITHACDFVTVSWNKFHDHWKVSLVGHSDSNGAEDTGKLHVTYHHNYFYNVFSRTPSVRFGTAHVYNNLYDDIEDAVHSRMNAQVLVERNVFTNVKVPLTTTGDSKVDGEAVEDGDDFGGAKPDITRQCTTFKKAPYKVTLDALEDVVRIVKAGAGPGALVGY